MKVFSFDAETDGLYGLVWAIGAVVLNDGDSEPTCFGGQLDPSTVKDEWVWANAIPRVSLTRYDDARALRDAFWAFWMEHKLGAVCIADIGRPVESGLIRACVEDDPSRTFEGPYPLHEVATLLLAAGVDPDIDRVAYSASVGQLPHNPVDDALTSALCWKRAYNAMQ